ncbi:MAG: hypothetical protein QOF20_805, partial [Acidimicrobiaceae bacterium]|nr:hypothetical protein [Acidimicrobiaceae bacterium]
MENDTPVAVYPLDGEAEANRAFGPPPPAVDNSAFGSHPPTESYLPPDAHR